jgi:hypothetical protein
LTENNFAWNVKIPASLAAGSYVLRHEIIGLHSAGNPNGAQNYPQVSAVAILFFAARLTVAVHQHCGLRRWLDCPRWHYRHFSLQG